MHICFTEAHVYMHVGHPSCENIEAQNVLKLNFFSNIGIAESTSENSILDFVIFVEKLLLQIYLQIKHVQHKLRPEASCAGMEGSG